MSERWMRIVPHNNPQHADVSIHTRNRHNTYHVSGKRYVWLIDWVRDNAQFILPFNNDGPLELQVLFYD